ncbi:MAG: DUF4271 domain-containing protein [Flavobacteriales bacterium]|nr:DUF4271 domain-containing protein [Flavobacteriales bacterium]
MQPIALVLDITPRLREVDHLFEPWMTWFLLGALILVVLVKVQYPQYIQLLGYNFTNYRIAKQTFIDNEYQIKPDWLFMFPVLVIGHALFLFLFLKSSASFAIAEGVGPFLTMCFLVAMVFMLKIVAMQLVSTIGKPGNSLKVYYGNSILVSELTGSVLLLLSIAASLSEGGPAPLLIYVGIGIYLLSYLFRLFRGVIAAIENRITLNYIILYLCTLEILPFVVLLKVFSTVYGV